MKLQFPEILDGNKSVTLNGMGYVFFGASPICQKFLDDCIEGKVVLDIGCGFSDIPLLALKKSITKYVANDLCLEHLDLLQQKIVSSYGNNFTAKLSLLHGKAPDVFKNIEDKFNAILADKVVHFLSPKEIDEFIISSKNLLAKDGKMYVTTASPYSVRYKTILKEYLIKKANGDKFAGYFTDIMDRLNLSEQVQQNYQLYTVPNAMTLFDRENLVALFEGYNMKVVKSYSFKIPTVDQQEWLECSDKESNLAGVVVVNNDE